MGLILDTNFLVALEREKVFSQQGPAHAFLSAHLAEALYLTFTVAGELACGRSLAFRSKWEQFCQPFEILGYSEDVAWQYGNLFRELQSRGLLIGANDLWIAATALVNDMPVVTRDAKEFGRVPGLRVLSY